MNERDYIGLRGETVFGYLIGKPCESRFWFVTQFLGDKAETRDFTVHLVGPACGEATFFVQVKATTKGYKGNGAKRKLRVSVTKRDIGKLKKVTGPAYVAGIDIVLEVGFLIAITQDTPDKQLSGIPCANKIDCTLIPLLWKEVEQYWTNRNMLAMRSLFS